MPSPELHRYTLANGLRVVLAPDRTIPVVGVSVHYDVGFRSEPEGRTGFAHLFEHLMFQGSESLEKLAHFRHVQGSGGVFNGSTHQDYSYYAPGNAVLTVAGDLSVDEATALIEKHFGDIPERAVPTRPSFAEPLPGTERRHAVPDAHAPLPALAL